MLKEEEVPFLDNEKFSFQITSKDDEFYYGLVDSDCLQSPVELAWFENGKCYSDIQMMMREEAFDLEIKPLKYIITVWESLDVVERKVIDVPISYMDWSNGKDSMEEEFIESYLVENYAHPQYYKATIAPLKLGLDSIKNEIKKLEKFLGEVVDENICS
jgi:hypothetical protein